jgi:lipopolysaccharide cholinephosphotransferase
MTQQSIKDVQKKILEIMVFIDKVCRENEIEYSIMGGTALGAVRHGGFIPWDDDLDIFMTPSNYEKFKSVFNKINSEKFVLQEWKIVDDYLEYAKVRMNGTTFIEEVYKGHKDMHHGIYVDIMMLHKCSNNKLIQKANYYASKYVTLVALSQRNWKPKTKYQKVALNTLKVLPNKPLSNLCYKLIYKYNELQSDYVYCYFITKANFQQGIFEKGIFEYPADIRFEGILLMGPTDIKKYLGYRYGNYLKLPSKEEQKVAVHAEIYDTERDYTSYFGVK